MKQFIFILFFLVCKIFVFAQTFTFNTVGSGLSYFPTAMKVYKNELYVSGVEYAGGLNVKFMGRWDGTQWKKVGGGLDIAVGSSCFAIHNDLLFFGGRFSYALDSNNQQINNSGYLIAWNGVNWVPVLTQHISDPTTTINAIASFNGDLYIGGRFLSIENTPINRIGRWDGQQWYDIGVNIIDYTGPPSILTMTVFNNELYVGGCFSKINGVEAFNIARWDGTQWHPVGSGTEGCVGSLYTDTVNNVLWVGGGIFTAGGLSTSGVALWDGVQWSIPDTPIACGVLIITKYNNNIFIGSPGCGSSYPELTYWNGSVWDSIVQFTDAVNCLAEYQNELYIGGYFTTVNNVTMNNITRLHVNTSVPLNENNKKKLLENNIPNPFSQNTTIPYKLPSDTKEAYLNISNIFGKPVKTIPLDLQKTEVKINMQNLSGGVYRYTLVLDGKVSETKKMVLLK